MRTRLVIRTAHTRRVVDDYQGPLPAEGDHIELGPTFGLGHLSSRDLMEISNKPQVVERFTVGERWFEWLTDDLCEVTLYAGTRVDQPSSSSQSGASVGNSSVS